MWKWERRDKKQKSKKSKMKKSGRGLLTVLAPIRKAKADAAVEWVDINQPVLNPTKANIPISDKNHKTQ